MTLGWMAKAVPAVTVGEGCCDTVNCEALAGLTVIPAETAEARLPEAKVKVMPPALVAYNPEKAAIPFDGITV